MNGNPAFENRHVLRVGGGSQGTISGSTVNQMTNEEKTLAVLFSAFGLHTDGFYRGGFLATRRGGSQAGHRSGRREPEILLARRARSNGGADGFLVHRGPGQRHGAFRKLHRSAGLRAARQLGGWGFLVAGAGLAAAARVRVGFQLGERRPHDGNAGAGSIRRARPSHRGRLHHALGRRRKMDVWFRCGRQVRLRRNQRGRRHLPPQGGGRRPGAGGDLRRGILSGGRTDPHRCQRPARLVAALGRAAIRNLALDRSPAADRRTGRPRRCRALGIGGIEPPTAGRSARDGFPQVPPSGCPP